MTPGGGVPARPAFRRLLLTGAGGFVGRHLREHAAAEYGDEIELVGCGPGERVDFDLSEPGSARDAVAGLAVDAVIHLAAQSSIVEATEDVERAWHVNVTGAAELVAALAAANPHLTALLASSAEVYGDAFLDGVVDEDTEPRPRTVYGRSKLAAERALAELLPPSAALVVARPANHIGPGQDRKFAAPSFAGQLAAGERAGRPVEMLVGNLDVQRDFMDVRDVARGYLALVRAAHGSQTRATYNMASGAPRPVRALLDGLRALARVDSRVTVDQARVRANEIPSTHVRADRIGRAIGWAPQIPFEDTLRAVMEDARERLGAAD